MKRFDDSVKGLAKVVWVCAITLAMGATSLLAQVQIYTYTDTLANLTANGGQLTVDDKTFSGFSYQVSGLTGFDANAITVTASQSGGVDYLTWSGDMSLVATDTAIADLVLNYIVTANSGTISMIDQRYIGTVTNAVLAVDETATSPGAPTAHSHLSVNDTSDPNSYPGGPFDVGENDLLTVAPAQATLYVTKDLSFAVMSQGGSVTVTQVEQSFHQVPEPGAMLFVSVGGTLLLLLNLRRRVKQA